MAAIFAVWLVYVKDMMIFTFVLWTLLFLGSALVPTCYGIIVSSVNREQQNASSAFGQIFFNISGFFLAPNVSGYVIDSFHDYKTGLTWGFRLVLAWNFFTCVFLIGALTASYIKHSEKSNK